MISIKETNVTIMVKNMDKSVKFYEALGLTIKNRWGDHYAQLTTTGITIGLQPPHENRAGAVPDNRLSDPASRQTTPRVQLCCPPDDHPGPGRDRRLGENRMRYFRLLRTVWKCSKWKVSAQSRNGEHGPGG